MMKVRHKPTVVDAVIWDGTPEALEEIAALGIEYGVSGHELTIFTLEGPRAALPGDVVIRGTVGEGYAVKPDVFAACYEPHTGALA